MKSKDPFPNNMKKIFDIKDMQHYPNDMVNIYKLYSLEMIFLKVQTFPERNCSKAFKNTITDNAYNDVSDYPDKQYDLDKMKRDKI